MFVDFRVHGLNKMGETPLFSFPVIRCSPAVKALEKGHVQPMHAKVREHGAPVQATRLVRKREICRTTNARGLSITSKPDRKSRAKPRDLLCAFLPNKGPALLTLPHHLQSHQPERCDLRTHF